jgi:hypothetical protein
MAIDKPNQQYPNSLGSFGPYMPNLLPDPSIRGSSFNELLNNRGIRFIHKIAAPCPNMNTLNDSNHDPECPFCDQSQILYVEEKEIWGVLSSNTLEKLYEIQGVWEVGTAVITFPTEYNDGIQADFNIFDQLICPDFQVRLSDLKEYDGLPQLGTKYPIGRVVNITSIVSGVKKQYVETTDFTIVDGKVQWVTGKEPNYNEIEEIGEVLSITYVANPVYNVLQTLHELRVTQELVDGVKTAKRLPQQVLVKRDFLFKANDGNS